MPYCKTASIFAPSRPTAGFQSSGKLAAVSFSTPKFHGFTVDEIRTSKILRITRNKSGNLQIEFQTVSCVIIEIIDIGIRMDPKQENPEPSQSSKYEVFPLTSIIQNFHFV